MRKMNTPKMEVIRFKNEDVIVSSGSSLFTFNASMSGFDDDTWGNGYFFFNNQSYKSTEYLNFINAVNTAYPGVNISEHTHVAYDGETNQTSILGFYESDSQTVIQDGKRVHGIDGNYKWSGDKFVRQ